MKYNLLINTAILTLLLTPGAATNSSAACTDGPIAGGTWTGSDDDPNSVADETNLFQYLDLDIEQENGSYCKLRLRYEADRKALFWEDNPMDPTKEHVIAHIVEGEYTILETGVGHLIFQTDSGKAYEMDLIE